MGLSTLIDTILFIFFLFIAIVAPLFDAQTCLPSNFFPDFLVDLKTTYARDNGDYLIAEKPNFFIGLIWLELLVQWPLSIANVYGILRKKSWLQTTCLIYGVCTVTAMSADRALQGSPLPSNTTIFRGALTLREPDSGCPWGSRPHTPDMLIGVPISGLAFGRYSPLVISYHSRKFSSFINGGVISELLNESRIQDTMWVPWVFPKGSSPFTNFMQGHVVLWDDDPFLEVAILSELVRSRKASDKLLMIYDPFLGLGLLATLRGIIPCSLMTASSSITRSGAARKKRA
ncbi:hypothetical protein GIB67_035891 [Kingdonia uniflora]|uniref:EXPERA domain-containing protein n=1 Tax=Kingdonia uniflora TaxID=39325 RepID=A0A7J7P9E6_9MAGN|nr:hypothetical protein GIB67_035891 [Kingdonia uniflora]